MDIKLNDTMGRGHIVITLKSHKMSDNISLAIQKTGEEKPFILRFEREALIKAIGAMK